MNIIDSLNIDIGSRICFLRKQLLNITSAEFSRRICISRYKLHRYETGQATVPAYLITIIASQFNLSEDWLLCTDHVRLGKYDNYQTTDDETYYPKI